MGRHDPRADAKIAHARTLLAQGRFEQARLAALRTTQASPLDPRTHALAAECTLLADSKGVMGEQVWHYITRAADLAPDDAQILLNMGRTGRILGRKDESIAALDRAVALAPAWPAAHIERASTLLDAGRVVDAAEACAAGCEAAPGDAGLIGMTAACALARGHAEIAYATMRDAAHAWPEIAPMWSGAALISNYVAGVSREESFELHRRYAALVEREAMDWPRPNADAITTHRPLRVGLLSPDLRGHSVARFVEPLLREHDRGAISIVVFQSNRITDDVTRRLKPMAREWHECATMTDDALAAFITSSHIDVLIELSGHTDAHSLPAIARRPAPVCVTYLGYPNTTGLSTVAARLVDARTDPAAHDSDRFATERLVRLARCFVCFEPPSDAPPSYAGNVPAPSAPAATPNRAVRYGSFNAIQKLNEATVALWSRVLHADPGSTLTLKSMTLRDERLRAEVVARFARAGIDPSRILARGPEKQTRDHLAAYHDIDVALDPFPYHGTTTTCEALWMGVPVVSRVGDRHASRVGASLLHAVGLDDLAVDDDEAFVAAAVGVGRDGGRRRAWRAMDEGGLRARVRRSDLCDGPGFSREFERVVAGLWQAWARA